MSCMGNLGRFITPNEVIIVLTKIYKYIGMNESFSKMTSSYMNKIVEQTIERDAFFLAKLLKLEISDTRLRLIITKNSAPRNREETILFNIAEVLSDIQMNYDKYAIQSNDQLNMINYIYSNQNIKFDITKDDKRSISQKSKRVLLDELNEKFDQSKNQVEIITLTLNYYIDISNLNAFTTNNKTLNYILLYLLLLKAEVSSFKYISFFEMIYTDEQAFNECLLDASYNWSEGLSQTLNFLRYVVKLILMSWEKTEAIVNEYSFDQNINKGDNIENTINNLSNIFTKDQIRIIHPYVSESTINRALQKLRDEKKIKPLGKGRSAKWIKISII